MLLVKIILQFNSVAQSCPTLCDSMDCSTPCLPIHHQLLEFTQIRIHWIGDAIQPPHPLSSPSPPAFPWVSLTLNVGYDFTASPEIAAAAPYLGRGLSPQSHPPDLEGGVPPLGPPASAQPPLLGCWVAPLGHRWCDHSPKARHLGMWSQVCLRKHHYRQS